jgi:Tfp pilus assembly protein FimT
MHRSRRKQAAVNPATRPACLAGFALSEQMIIVVILGILASTANIGFQDVRRYWQRQSINAVVKDLAYWLDQVRSRASLGTVCTVTVNTSSAAAAGAALATVQPSACGSSFQLDAASLAQLGTLAIATDPGGGATITFNTDGGATPQTVAAVNGFSGVEIAIASASADLRRCLAISTGSGSTRLGGSASSTGACDYSAPI